MSTIHNSDTNFKHASKSKKKAQEKETWLIIQTQHLIAINLLHISVLAGKPATAVVWTHSRYATGYAFSTGAKRETSRNTYSIMTSPVVSFTLVTATLARLTMGFPF